MGASLPSLRLAGASLTLYFIPSSFRGADQRYSHRFGITWQDDDPTSIQFRADFLRTLRSNTPPTVVLGAYADAATGQYQSMFPHHVVDIHRLGPVLRLDVELEPDWHINRLNLTAGRQKPRRQHLMDEVGRLTEGSPAGSLVLSSSKAVTYLSQSGLANEWKRQAPSLNQHAPAGKRSIEFAYWFAGRGLNSYSGRHVIALHAPERPTLFEHHVLAALAPRDAAQRKKLAGHLLDTELLQMLHRGRQTRFPAGHAKRPRVILAFKPRGDLRQWLAFEPMATVRPVRPDTTNLHHQHALEILALELHQLLGAIPHACLSVLDLYGASRSESLHIPHVRSALKRLTRHKKRVAPVLNDWKGDNSQLTRRFSPYTALSGDKRYRVLAALSKQETLKPLQSITVTTTWPGGKTRVYAVDATSAERAVRLLGG